MHHAIGEAAIVGKQQQAAGIEIEATDRDPAPVLQPWQFSKYAGPAGRIIARDDFAFGLVIHQHARQALLELELDQLAIHANPVFRPDALSDMGWLAIDADAASEYPFLQFAARAEAGIGQCLVQFRRINEDRSWASCPARPYSATAPAFIGSPQRRLGRPERTSLAARAAGFLAFRRRRGRVGRRGDRRGRAVRGCSGLAESMTGDRTGGVSASAVCPRSITFSISVSGGNSARLRRPRSSRNLRVVAYSAGTARGITMSDGIDPATSFQRLEDIRRYGDTAHILDVAACHRLAIGDDGQGFHHGARILRRPFVLQAVDVGLVFGPALEAPAGRQLHQFDAALAPVAAQVVEQAERQVSSSNSWSNNFFSSASGNGSLATSSAVSSTRL
jgi:hypothetical protein